MRGETVSIRDLLRSRLFWLCALALGQGILFLLFPRLPASMEIVFGATLIVLLAGVVNEGRQPHSGAEGCPDLGRPTSRFRPHAPQATASVSLASPPATSSRK
jgi:hypothetical protein